MTQVLNNFLIEEYSPMKSKPFFHGGKLKFIVVFYCIWVFISIMLVYIQPHKYASYFTDLPQYLKNVPSFVVSIVYLDLFIPAVVVTILLMLYILLIVIKNAYKK